MLLDKFLWPTGGCLTPLVGSCRAGTKKRPHEEEKTELKSPDIIIKMDWACQNKQSIKNHLQILQVLIYDLRLKTLKYTYVPGVQGCILPSVAI